MTSIVLQRLISWKQLGKDIGVPKSFQTARTPDVATNRSKCLLTLLKSQGAKVLILDMAGRLADR